jgi:archaellum component FlaC
MVKPPQGEKVEQAPPIHSQQLQDENVKLQQKVGELDKKVKDLEQIIQGLCQAINEVGFQVAQRGNNLQDVCRQVLNRVFPPPPQQDVPPNNKAK